MGKIIGIDLGTTNSVMAVMEGGTPQIIVNAEGGHTTPSVVAWKNGDRMVGKVALNQQTMNVDNTIHSVKRLIGRRYDEMPHEDLDALMYRVERGADGRPSIKLDPKEARRDSVSPEEVSAAVLSKLKADAEMLLGEEVTDAVVTVPAYFGDAQRQATQAAAQIAGLNVRRIINEPTAAALAYGIDRVRNRQPGMTDSDRVVLVFDLGGGTLDVSILIMSGELIRVISTAGDNHLGGDDIDEMLANFLCDEFEEEHGIDLREDPSTYARIREASRSAKEDLSSTIQATINLPFISAIGSSPVHLNRTLMRSEFERLISDFVEKCKEPISKAIASSRVKLSVHDLTDVILVGGSTRIPLVQSMVSTFCGLEPQRTVNPDEVVAMGAAIETTMVSDSTDSIVPSVVLSDVNSISLGVRLADNTVDILIPKNTALPVSRTSRHYTNATDNQTSINLVIIQGEDTKDASSPKNSVLGRATISGFAPMPADTADVTVTMTCDVNGMIEVTGRDEITGKGVMARINATGRLSRDDIESLQLEERAEKRAEQKVEVPTEKKERKAIWRGFPRRQ